MAHIKFYLDKPFDQLIPQHELNQIIKKNSGQNKNYPKKILNPYETSLYAYFTYNKSSRVKINTGIKVLPVNWDFKIGKFKSSYRSSFEANNELEELNVSIIESYRNLKKVKTDIIDIDIKKMLFKIINGEEGLKTSRHEFFNARRDFFIKKALVLQPGTLKEYKTVFKSLDDFEGIESIELTFQNFNQQFFDKYESYLITKKNPTHHERGLLNDTIAKYCSTLKAFLLWAFDNNYHDNRRAFENIKTQIKKKSENEIVVLSEEELNLLINVDLTAKPYLERVRDLFCFGCYTGQRFSDIMNFSKVDLIDEKWTFMSIKGKKQLSIPIVGFIYNARKILLKYDYELPVISNQKFNDYLKEVGIIAKVNTLVKIIRFSGIQRIEIIKEKHEFMSSHMARRTFVTLLLNNNVPITVVKKLTGHSDIRTLMKYEQTSYENTKVALMENF